MFVNTNVAAMNAWLNLSNTQTDMTNVLGQLSSGLKINSAADNPAGLAIAQQMQSEVSGMNQAYQNAQTGINLFQTADSALGQIQSILQSMRSLASQAATGTNNSTDLNALQAEMNQYTQQISQVTNDTNFNTLNLLGGAFQGQSIQIGADQNQSLSVGIAAADAYSLGVTGVQGSITTAGSVIESAGLAGGQSVNAAGVPVGSYSLGATVTPWNLSGINGTTADFGSLAGSYNASTADTMSVKVVSTGATNTIAVTDGNTGTTTQYSSTGLAFNNVSMNGSAMTLTLAGTPAANDTLQFTLNPTSTAFNLTGSAAGSATVTGAISTGAVESISVGSGALSFAVQGTTAAETSSSYTTATYTSPATTAAPAAPAALTATAFDLTQSGASATTYTNGTGNAKATTGIDITTQADAQAALTVLGNAINTVSNQRATIGAYQNRLQFAASDLQASSQNLTSARAQIMDADIAQGMSQLTRDQILQQAGVGMLAQANAMPQALLKLIP